MRKPISLSLDTTILDAARAQAAAKELTLEGYIEALVMRDFKAQANGGKTVIFAPEGLPATYEVVRDPGESEASFAEGKEFVDTLMNAVRGLPGSDHPGQHGQHEQAVMTHRHIDPKGWSLAKIDDVIGRGDLAAWTELRDAVRADAGLLPKIRKIASHGAAHGEDVDAYCLWLHIADALEVEHRSPHSCA